MRTTVVSGMLGSGKTTFIAHLLNESRERTVVLVNDFGALGIDGEVFSVVGIVDATEFLELHEAEVFGTFFRDQIVNADVILVNKIDLAGEETTRRTVAAIVLRTVQVKLEATLTSAWTPLRSRSRRGHPSRRWRS